MLSGRSDGNDIDDFRQADEVCWIACIERQAFGHGCRSDKKIHRASSPRLAPSGRDGRIQASVRAGDVRVYRQRFEGGFGPLQPVLPAGTFCRIRCGGAAASSAKVTAEIAISCGSVAGSIRSRSITTEVSIRPRGGRRSATGRWILTDQTMDVPAEPRAGHTWGSGKDGGRRICRHEPACPERG